VGLRRRTQTSPFLDARKPSRFLGVAGGLLIIAAAASFAPQRGSKFDSADPSRVLPPPSGAVGFPSRDPGFDARPGFKSPPPGFGEVAFFWWLGDPLTKERLLWHLDQLAGKSVSGLQINYAHTDRGGVSYGLSMPSDPPIFSPAWWELVGWFAGEAGRRGMSISLSDYTLGLGQGHAMDQAIAEIPDLAGSQLAGETKTFETGGDVEWALPRDWISVTAVEGAPETPSGNPIDLRGNVRDRRLRWRAPSGGRWTVVAVTSRKVMPSLDPTHPESGRAYIRLFYSPFEKYLPGQAGKALNFFFSDELDFRLPGFVWSERLAAEFRERKGYDLRPLLTALFIDVGPRTPKIRMDYNDVRVALSEENFFRPVFEWHQARGMIFGCDHGGRGQDVAEFGDYFRTQRWNQGPGSDQPLLEKNLIKAKIAASISHLYERPRVWLEGFHSSGWGTTPSGVVDATFADFLMGYNLLSFHGLYYSTHGGWWEWAPPDNHWRMPYWGHMGGFMKAVERLSFLLSQGRHVCDVAVLYPVAPVEAGMDGPKAVETAFETGRRLYGAGVDFDFMDFESLLRAEVGKGGLSVAGETYRILVLPAMRAMRFEALNKAAAFAAAGGTVIAVGALPVASERAGRDDSVLDRLVRDCFGLTAKEAASLEAPHVKLGETGGVTAAVRAAGDVLGVIEKILTRDFAYAADPKARVYFQHRRVGPRDVYGVYGLPKGTSVTFRATGAVELWDPWTGASRPLAAEAQNEAGTRLRLPREATEIQLIIFRPGRAAIEAAPPVPLTRSIDLSGPWTVELKPTLDNRWGDFRWPPTIGMIGAEARRVRYRIEDAPQPELSRPDVDDSSWAKQTAGFGPMFWKLGPVPEDVDRKSLEGILAGLKAVDPSVSFKAGARALSWQPYDYSRRWGAEDDPGHQGYHGLKEEVSDEFIRLGKPKPGATSIGREREAGGAVNYLWTTVASPGKATGRISTGGMKPSAVWVGGRAVADAEALVPLLAGATPILLRYDRPGTGWFVISDRSPDPPAATPGSLAMRWFGATGILPFDIHPEIERPVGWYRFRAAPGMKAFAVTVLGGVSAWADGRALAAGSRETGPDGAHHIRFVLPEPSAWEALVALRIEHVRGFYGGAALPEPVAFECGPGLLEAGDWSKREGLETYSGGMLYKRTISLLEGAESERLILDLGAVASSAEVFVNGRSAGVRVAPPWRWEIGPLARPGTNSLEVLVYNTLSNHYATVPTRYRGNSASGLLGPARLILEPAR